MDQFLLALCVGVSLAAACGFRIFVPLLVMSLAARTGHLTIAENFSWMSSDLAVATFAIATFAELGAYLIPALDNLLDGLAAPAALVAGTVATAACVGDMSPFLTWSVAIIAGGGAAGVTQATTTVLRATSTATTGGLGNPVVSTAEAGGAVGMAALAVFIPILAAILAIIMVLFFLGLIIRFFRRRAERKTLENTSAEREVGAPVIQPAVVEVEEDVAS